MKNTTLKAAVLSACAALLPVAGNAALVYTPPQAMVLTCNGVAPQVTDKTGSLATFACADGQTPQAGGVTSGMGNLLGLATGSAVLAASEAVPSMALPGTGTAATPGNGSGAGSNGASSGSSGNGAGSTSTGSSNSNGAGNGSDGSGSASGSGSGSDGSGSASGGNQGGWWGHLLHKVGHVVQQIGHAAETGGTVTILGSPPAQGTEAPGSTPSGSPFSGLNQLAHPATGPVSPMAGAAPGTIELHSRPGQLLVLTGGDPAYRGLVGWVMTYESHLNLGWYLDIVIHPGPVTHERLPLGGDHYYAYRKMPGTADFFLTMPGHKYLAYPGNPVPFVLQVNLNNQQNADGQIEQEIKMQAQGPLSAGPQFYAMDPGNRNGPFWPSPLTTGSPKAEVTAACEGFANIEHDNFSSMCWSVNP